MLNNPAVGKCFNDPGYIPAGSQPEEFAAYMRSEIQKLSKVLNGL